MQVYRDYHNLPVEARGTAVAIGNFDGVHRGHRLVIEATHKIARRHEVPLAVMTFEPHPREVIQPETAPPRLTSFRGKCRQLRSLGVDMVFALRFGTELMSMPAENFVEDVLGHRFNVAAIVTGEGFRFGHRRAGDTELLRRCARGLGVEVWTVPPLELDGERCSSSRIRALVQAGDVAAAATLLSRPYNVIGVVRPGDRRGRTIGFPTANLHGVDSRLLLPARGVYAVTASLPNGQPWPAVANLGIRPTVDGRQQLLEVHLLDRHLDLYGERLDIRFLERLRGEQKFDGLDQLKEQIARDCARARIILGVAPRVQTSSPAALTAMTATEMS